MGGVMATLALAATDCASRPPRSRVVRIGGISAEMITGNDPPQQQLDIEEGLRDAGFIGGVNMAITWRHAQGDRSMFADAAREFAAANMDVIIAATTTATLAAKAATSTIPIVMVGVGDPVESGVITSVAHPGGNVTGTAFSNTDEGVKRLELLNRAFPGISKVVLLDPEISERRRERMTDAARALHLDLRIPRIVADQDFASVFGDLPADAGVVEMGHTLIWRNRDRIVALAAERRVPVVYSRQDDVEAGGLMSYGTDRKEFRVRTGYFVRQIVDGARPGDLPVQLDWKYDLAVNLAAASRAGITIPQHVLLQATKVIG